MEIQEKKEIQALLIQYIAQYPSQAKAAASLKNVSEATVIQIKNGKWDNVSDEMFRNVGKQVGYSSRGTWQIAETRTFKQLVELLNDAQENSMTHAIEAASGRGKTYTAEWYERNRANVYHIICAEYYTPKNFLAKLLKKMGREATGSVSDMMDLVIETLLRQKNPLIILDEADKLRDRTLYFFITLYNMLSNQCGLVLMATHNLSRRITKKLHRMGYEEIFSRVGRRFIQLSETTKKDVSAICEANGISDPAVVMNIYNEYEGDLRRVEKMVHKFRKLSSNHLKPLKSHHNEAN